MEISYEKDKKIERKTTLFSLQKYYDDIKNYSLQD